MKRQNAKSAIVPVRRLAHATGLPLPAYQSEGAAGLDLVAAVPESKPLKLKRGDRVLVPTGLVIELPTGTEAQVRPRSGLALRDGLTVLNSPGTIDSDYRGELQVILINLGQKAVTIRRGDRIAQLVMAPVMRAQLEVSISLADTKRGDGGFGSTGVAAEAAGKSPAKRRPPPPPARGSKSVKKSKNVAPSAPASKAVARRARGRARPRR